MGNKSPKKQIKGKKLTTKEKQARKQAKKTAAASPGLPAKK